MIKWLFEIDALRLSTIDTTHSAVTYSGVIIPDSFSGIQMRWNIAGNGLIAPNDVSFDVSNPDSTYTTSEFEGEFCTIKLIIDDVLTRTWKVKIKRAISYYGKITCTCVDFLQDHLVGDYPNTPSPKELWPSDDADEDDERSDDYCVPVILGTAYIPVRSVNTGTERHYVLGESGPTYTIDEVRTPRAWPNSSTWDAASYDMDQSTDSGYRLLQPKIDERVDPPATGLWPSGDTYYDMLCKYSRSDTAALTNPAEWVEYLLEEYGVDSADIGATSFAAADALYDTLGITFDGGGWWRREPRERILSNVLAHTDSYIIQTDKVELYQFNLASQETITNVLSLSFSPRKLTRHDNDSGRVSWPNTGDPQDKLTGKAVVPIQSGGTTASTASDTLQCRFMVGQSENAQRAGTLYFQKKIGAAKRINFSTTLTSLTNADTISPGKVVTINNSLYGGAFYVVLTDMSVNLDLTVNFTGVVFDNLEDWDDLTPPAIPIIADDTPESGGIGSRSVSLTSDALSFVYDTTGANPSPASATFTATAFNTAVSTVYYRFLVDDVEVQHTTTNTYTYTPQAAYTNMPQTVKVEIRENGTGEVVRAASQVSVSGVRPGSDGSDGLNSATVILYKRSATTPAKPTTTATYTFSTGVLTGHDNGWTQGVPTTDGNPLWIITAVALATAPADTDTIASGEWSTPTILAEDGTDGSAGTDGLNTATIFLYQRAATDPALTDIDDPVTYTFATTAITGSIGAWSRSVPAGSPPLWVTAATAVSSTATDTIARSEWATPVIMAEDGADGDDGVDGADGTDAITVVLSSPAHSIPFDGDDTLITGGYSGTGTTLKVYEGTTALAYDGAGTAAGTWKVSVVDTNITVGTLTDSGTYLTVGDASALTDTTASITFTITGKRLDGTSLGNIDAVQSFTKVKYGNRSGSIFTFEESTDAYITAANVTQWVATSLTDTAAAQNVARSVMAESEDDYIRPNDRITVTDNSASIAATRVYTGAAKSLYTAVATTDFSALVVEAFDGSVIVDGTLSADKLAANTTLTNNLVVGSNMSLNTSGAIFTTNKTTYADTDAGFFLGYDSTAHKLNIGDATNYLKWDGSNLTIAGSLSVLNPSDVRTDLNVADGADVAPGLPSDGNLVGYWSFDDGSGTVAFDSHGDNDGTISGASWVNGVSGKCLSFDGTNDYVEVTGLKSSISSAFSFSAWFNANTITGDNRAIFEQDVMVLLRLENTDEAGRITARLHDGTDYEAATISSDNGDIALNTWYHVVQTWDGSTHRLYINASLISSVAYSGSLNVGGSDIANIGDRASSNDLFIGKIDEVRIYNTALTPQEVKSLYLNPGGNKSPLPGADNTTTTIDDGLITTGTLQLKDGAGTTKAGITAADTGDTSTRAWFGATYANRDTAPCRITQAGKLYATGAVIVGDYKSDPDVGSNQEGVHISAADNRIFFWGDRGDSTITNLVKLGTGTEGGENYLAYFGSYTYDNDYAIIAYCKDGTGIKGASDTEVGIRARSNATSATGPGTSALRANASAGAYSIYATGDAYFEDAITALSYADNTPFYEGDALSEIRKIKGKDGEIDHETLPTFVQKKTKIHVPKKDENGKEIIGKDGDIVTDAVDAIGRDLGAMISVLTVGIQQLTTRIEALEATNESRV